MNFFETCVKGKAHFPTPTMARKYRNDKNTLVCKCGGLGICIEAGIWGDKQPPKVGDICKRCNSKRKYKKTWIHICPVCEEVA
jgi:hypothetical protein